MMEERAAKRRIWPGVDVQIIRDWVVRFNAEGPDGLINRRAPGKPSRLNDV